MHFSTVLTFAASAALVAAAPLEKRAYTTKWVIDTVTTYTTVYATPVASSASAIGAIQQSTSAVLTSAPAPAPVPTTSVYTPPPPPPATTSVAVVASSAPAAPAASGQCSAFDPNQSLSTSPLDCGVPIIDTVNKWRSKYGKPTLTWATNLAQAAQRTVSYNQGGVTEVHPGLIDGSMGECVTPGFWETGNLATQGLTPFEVGLMGWLCEVSSDPQLQASANGGVNVCSISRNVASIDSSGERGHHDIFLNPQYSKIGCWFEYNVKGDGGWPQFAGQIACDFS